MNKVWTLIKTTSEAVSQKDAPNVLLIGGWVKFDPSIEKTKEVLRNYLAKPDRDLIRLRRYADTLGCKKILGTYLEVLL